MGNIRAMNPRFGLNLHRNHWPTAPALKAHEAAGFSWVQVHTPPSSMLCGRERTRLHARALRRVLDTTGLRLVLHGPDDLTAGAPQPDRAFEGLLDYAYEARAELVVVHALNIALGDRERAAAEEHSLQRLAERARRLGTTLALENLAPVYPSQPRICHDPLAVRDLVRRLENPAARMLFDIGHAHITGKVDTLKRCRGEIVLFHVHDNLGARLNGLEAPGVDPLRLDLHLAPGAGSLPWHRLAGLLRDHSAPLMLEVEPSNRPGLVTLAETAEHVVLDAPLMAVA
jgi:sugar phosphate isomerase/epimerase